MIAAVSARASCVANETYSALTTIGPKGATRTSYSGVCCMHCERVASDIGGINVQFRRDSATRLPASISASARVAVTLPGIRLANPVLSENAGCRSRVTQTRPKRVTTRIADVAARAIARVYHRVVGAIKAIRTRLGEPAAQPTTPRYGALRPGTLQSSPCPTVRLALTVSLQTPRANRYRSSGPWAAGRWPIGRTRPRRGSYYPAWP
jgi:hypothetical protein